MQLFHCGFTDIKEAIPKKTRPTLSCASTEVVYNGTGYQDARFKQALAKVNPPGWTPIAKALKSAKQDVNPLTTETIVYVVVTESKPAAETRWPKHVPSRNPISKP